MWTWLTVFPTCVCILLPWYSTYQWHSQRAVYPGNKEQKKCQLLTCRVNTWLEWLLLEWQTITNFYEESVDKNFIFGEKKKCNILYSDR